MKSLKKHVGLSESLEAVNNNIQEMQTRLQQTRAPAAEQRDKENCRNSIILYKVTNSDAATVRREIKLMSHFAFNFSTPVHSLQTVVVNVFRLGRRDESNNTAPRPQMVQLASYTFKNLIRESLWIIL